MRKIGLFALVLVTGLGILTGCGKDKASTATAAEETATESSEVTTEETEAVVEEESHEGKYQSELTNEWIDESLKNQRPIAVMVDNEKTALPHFGLSTADVVYEITNSEENNGVTRFMAIVKDWGSIEQFGSIRSVRSTNLMLAPEWNAVVCHDGGPFYIDEYLAHDYVENFSGTFSRVDNGKPAEFTEYILPGDLEENFANSGYSKEYNEYYQGAHYKFATEKVDLSANVESKDCNLVDLPFPHNSPELEYNAEDGLYYYYEYGSAHVDPVNDNAQLAFKNVILQNAEYQLYDTNGYLVFLVNTSGRSGYYITEGKSIPITWSKESDIMPTRYYDSDGNEIQLNTGKTYVGIVPDNIWGNLNLN